MNNLNSCTHYYYNDKFLSSETACIYADDRGFSLGDGVFETLLSYKYKVPFFNQHWTRLNNSAKELGISLSDKYSKEYVYSKIIALLKQNYPLLPNNENQYRGIKITITRGRGPRSIEPLTDYKYQHNLIITTFTSKPLSLDSKTLTIKNCSYIINQHLVTSRIKSLNYLDRIIAKQQAQQSQFSDALLCNLSDNLCCSTTSNIFFITTSEQILTPPLTDGILAGITRQFVIDTAKTLEHSLTEQSITYDYLKNNQDNITAAFTTNSIQGINQVRKIDELILSQHPFIDSIYQRLKESYRK